MGRPLGRPLPYRDGEQRASLGRRPWNHGEELRIYDATKMGERKANENFWGYVDVTFMADWAVLEKFVENHPYKLNAIDVIFLELSNPTRVCAISFELGESSHVFHGTNTFVHVWLWLCSPCGFRHSEFLTFHFFHSNLSSLTGKNITILEYYSNYTLIFHKYPIICSRWNARKQFVEK